MLDKKIYIIICFFIKKKDITDFFENYKQRMAEKPTIETQLKKLNNSS